MNKKDKKIEELANKIEGGLNMPKTFKDVERCDFAKADDYSFYTVRNRKGELLGNLEYYKKWKQWVWSQGEQIIMSRDCLEEVLNFMKDLEKS